ncbi:MAG: response regulator [Lentisphaeraceae bacterium]|nr:response regulator [Lentisphaeraceae bacterium]
MQNIIVADHLDKGIFYLDKEGLIQYWNKWLSAKTGISANDAKGKSLQELFPELGKKFAYKQLLRALKGRNSLILSPILHKNLIPMDCPSVFIKEGFDSMIQQVQGFAVTDNERNFLCYVIQIEDHTERFYKEIKLQKYYTELEKRNKELNKAQEELQVINRNLDASNRYKSEFLANMSHEIRTPMNSIIGLAELLLEDSKNLSSHQEELVNVLNLSSKNLLELINNILDLAKISAEKLVLEKIPFDMSELLQEVYQIITPRKKQENIEFLYSCPGVSSSLLGDPTRVKQIFLNLIGNSAKFTKRGHIHTKVSIKEQSSEQVTLNIVISDSGIGIPSASINNIFENFVQADGSTTREYGGTGLGLSLVRQLITLMGGEIKIESVEYKGTTVSFSIVLDKSDIKVQSPEPRDLMVLYIETSEFAKECMNSLATDAGVSLEVCSPEDFSYIMIDQNFDFVFVNTEILDINQLKKLKSFDGKTTFVNVYPLLMGRTNIGLFTEAFPKPFSKKSFEKIIQPLAKKETALVHPAEGCDTELRILIAEDNKANRFLIKKILKKFPNIEFALNGLEAVSRTRQSTFDIILMDLLMPEMDGLEATRQIRKFNPDIPIVALTANNLVSDKQECLEAGMNDYLLKPIDRHKLFQAIRTYTL